MYLRTTLFAFAVLLAPTFVQAETVVRIAESVVVGTDQRIEDDFYAAGSEVVHTGTVAGDLLAAGRSVSVKGPVEADVAALAAHVDIDDVVGDDVRIIAGEAVLSGEITGDVFFVGGSLHVLPTASVGGDVYVFGGEADIAGAVGGAIRGRMERLRIDAPIAGEVHVVSRQSVTLGSSADIAGDVRYESMRTIARAPEAVVQGELLEQEIPLVDEDASLMDRLFPALIMLFGALVLYLLGRSFFSAVVGEALSRPARSGLIGLAVYVVVPVVAVAAIISILGLVIGVGVLGAAIVGYALSYSIVPMVLGTLLWYWFTKKATLQPFGILAGVCIVHVVLMIPLLGPFLIFLASAISIGALTEVLFRRILAKR